MSIKHFLINKKVNTITPDELMKLSKQYQVSLSQDQATKIAALLKGQNVDLFDEAQRKQLLVKIANVSSKQTALQIDSIFQKLT
jgi:hypothetical protein